MRGSNGSLQAIPPFVDDEPYPGCLRHGSHCRDTGGSRYTVFKCDAFCKATERRFIRDPLNEGQVTFFDFEAGMHQPVGQLTVVRHQQQPFGIVIESPYGVQPNRDVTEVVCDRFSPPRIRETRNDFFRFVKQIGVFVFRFYHAAVHFNDIARLIHFRAQFRHCLTVYPHPSR